MELLREEVNTQVAVLAGLRRGGDADDLARTALEDQEIANADVVARDGDGVGIHVAVMAWVMMDMLVLNVGRASMRMNVDFAFLYDDFFAVDLLV